MEHQPQQPESPSAPTNGAGRPKDLYLDDGPSDTTVVDDLAQVSAVFESKGVGLEDPITRWEQQYGERCGKLTDGFLAEYAAFVLDYFSARTPGKIGAVFDTLDYFERLQPPLGRSSNVVVTYTGPAIYTEVLFTNGSPKRLKARLVGIEPWKKPRQNLVFRTLENGSLVRHSQAFAKGLRFTGENFLDKAERTRPVAAGFAEGTLAASLGAAASFIPAVSAAAAAVGIPPAAAAVGAAGVAGGGAAAIKSVAEWVRFRRDREFVQAQIHERDKSFIDGRSPVLSEEVKKRDVLPSISSFMKRTASRVMGAVAVAGVALQLMKPPAPPVEQQKDEHSQLNPKEVMEKVWAEIRRVGEVFSGPQASPPPAAAALPHPRSSPAAAPAPPQPRPSPFVAAFPPASRHAVPSAAAEASTSRAGELALPSVDDLPQGMQLLASHLYRLDHSRHGLAQQEKILGQLSSGENGKRQLDWVITSLREPVSHGGAATLWEALDQAGASSTLLAKHYVVGRLNYETLKQFDPSLDLNNQAVFADAVNTLRRLGPQAGFQDLFRDALNFPLLKARLKGHPELFQRAVVELSLVAMSKTDQGRRATADALASLRL